MSISIPIVIAFFVTLLLFHLKRHAKTMPLPPGPKPLPLVGNIHQLDNRTAQHKLQQWHKEHGPVVSLRLGAHLMISLGSHKAANDLLERRSSIYSSRPRMFNAFERVIKGRLSVTLPDNDAWKLHRRLYSSCLNLRVPESHHRLLYDVESKQVLHDLLLLESDDFGETVRRYAFSLAFALGFGRRITHPNAAEIVDIDDLVQCILNTFTSSNLLLDSLPMTDRARDLLDRLTGRKQITDDIDARAVRIFGNHIDAAVQRGLSWTWAEYLTRELQQSSPSAQQQQQQLCWVSLELYLAATVSTTMVLEIFVLATMLNPDAARDVQEELDRVVGPDRMPSLDDSRDNNLPLLNAFLKELYRWRPIAAMGVPRAVRLDDQYMGYHIPANTIVFASHWVLNMDEEVYENPTAFQPQRWLQQQQQQQQEQEQQHAGLLPEPATFGFGRRVCPGRHFAHKSLLITIARLLWAFEIGPPSGDQQDMPDSMESSYGSIGYRPAPFKASFHVRSAKHRAVIEREWMVTKDACVC